ncbi:MAG TPA: hypothetical protein PKM16_09480 [Bacteroidia bacterium]|nr:hypothetical protein [Bacteroidia bacterium]HNS11890.1 hypothetical protein [Bacteroidia bacterium]
MKPIFTLTFILFLKLILFSSVYTYSQSDSSNATNNKIIGIGGYILRNSSLISLEYGRRTNNWNELTIPLYFTTEGKRKDIAISGAYHIALVKKRSRFNFFVSPELNLAYGWYERLNTGSKVSRYGYFICFGLIPQVRLTDRIVLVYEIKLGHGFLWANNDRYRVNNDVIYTERGWYFRYLPAFRLKYSF